MGKEGGREEVEKEADEAVVVIEFVRDGGIVMVADFVWVNFTGEFRPDEDR